jgi:hypothetical protein
MKKVAARFTENKILVRLYVMAINVWVYETFGISERKPVKPLQRQLSALPSKLALSAKCFIYRIRASKSFIKP